MVHRVEHRPHKHARQTELPLPQLINDCGPLHVIIDSPFRPPSRPVVVIQSFWTTSGLLVEQSGHVFLLVVVVVSGILRENRRGGRPGATVSPIVNRL
jgi:hypothetical protein